MSVGTDATNGAPLPELEQLIAEIEDTLSRIQQKRTAVRKRSAAVFLSQVVLIFLTTVLLGLKWSAHAVVLTNIALVTSAGATLMSTIAGYFNYRDRWLEHTRTVGELRGLLGDAKSARLVATGKPEPGPVAELRLRLRRILGESMQRWVEIKYVEPPSPATDRPGQS
jgi:hypothetical protein